MINLEMFEEKKDMVDQEVLPEEEDKEEEANMDPHEAKEKIRSILSNFLEEHSIYDLLPVNGQVLVFNTNLTLCEAINSLAAQNIYCAILWDSEQKEFTNLVTIRDVLEMFLLLGKKVIQANRRGDLLTNDSQFINNFLEGLANEFELANAEDYHGDLQESKEDIIESLIDIMNKDMRELVNNMELISPMLKHIKLTWWTHLSTIIVKNKPVGGLLGMCLEHSILHACEVMSKHHLHRMAIIDQERKVVCGIITHDMIINYIIGHLDGEKQLFDTSIKYFNIGSCNITFMKDTDTLLAVLMQMKDRHVSALPIVKGDTGETIGLFSLRDLIILIRTKDAHKLYLTMGEIMRKVNLNFEFESAEELMQDDVCETEKYLSSSLKKMSIEEGENIKMAESPTMVPQEEGSIGQLGFSGLTEPAIMEDQVDGNLISKNRVKADKIMGIDRVFTYTDEESIKVIIEKLLAAPDKRLIQIDYRTLSVIKCISFTDLLNFVTTANTST